MEASMRFAGYSSLHLFRGFTGPLPPRTTGCKGWTVESRLVLFCDSTKAFNSFVVALATGPTALREQHEALIASVGSAGAGG